MPVSFLFLRLRDHATSSAKRPRQRLLRLAPRNADVAFQADLWRAHHCCWIYVLSVPCCCYFGVLQFYRGTKS